MIDRDDFVRKSSRLGALDVAVERVEKPEEAAGEQKQRQRQQACQQARQQE